MDGGLDNTVNALAVSPVSGHIFAGGQFTENVQEWNGSTWVSMDGGTNDRVWDIKIANNGRLYAGGEFTTAGSTASANYVAEWNGTTCHLWYPQQWH